MPALFGLLPWLASTALTFLSSRLFAYLAMKVVLVSLLTITLPIVLKNLINWFFTATKTSLENGILGLPPLPELAYQYTGLAGYFAGCFRLSECVAVLLTGLTIHFSLRLIPGL